jgi:hypothetical protein
VSAPVPKRPAPSSDWSAIGQLVAKDAGYSSASLPRLDVDSFVSVYTRAEQRQQSAEDNTDESSCHALTTLAPAKRSPRGYW